MESTKKVNVKKTIDVIVNVILWLFVIFAVAVTIIAVSAGGNKKNIPTIGGTCYLSVQSDSMNAKKPDWVKEDKPYGFKKGDLIFGKYIADDADALSKVEEGDIITYEYDMNKDGVISPGEYNTHRVKSVRKTDGKVDYFETIGDNEEFSHGKTEEVSVSKVIAVYTGKKAAGLGSALGFLSSQLGFGLCILLPLALFFGYELFVFIKTLLKVKNEGKKMITAEDEEAIKQRAVEEYLRRKQEEEKAFVQAAEEKTSKDQGEAEQTEKPE